MKIISQTVLHYGADFLGYALRSVIDHVDEAWILYSAQGSHGHQTDLMCPDHAATLYDIAKQAAGDKLRWYTASPRQWAHEGIQREFIHQLVPDADVILVLDADEVWHPNLAELAADMYEKFYVNGIEWKSHRVRIPMVHAWRSFSKWVAHDPAYPERIIFPKELGKPTITLNEPEAIIFHFGYAQRSEIVRYKLTTHGHKNELRPDWFETRFAVNAQADCHPVGSDHWQPEDVDPYSLGLPEWMKEHPFSQLDVIP